MENKEQIHQQCLAWASSGLQLGHKIVCIFIHRLETISPSFLLKINLHLKDYCFLLIQLYISPALQKSLLTLCNLSTWPLEYNFNFLTCIWFAYSCPKASRFWGVGICSASSPASIYKWGNLWLWLALPLPECWNLQVCTITLSFRWCWGSNFIHVR